MWGTATGTGAKLNILDCPGYADFYGDVRAGLRVADGVIVVVSATAGVEVGTELIWQHLERHGVPRIIAVSKMDKEHADFRGCVDACAETLRARLAPVIVPIGSAEKLEGVVDLIEQKAYMVDGSGNTKKQDIPAGMADEVAEWRTQLVEAAAESKEELMEKFFSEQPLSVDEIMAGLRAGVRQASVVPVVALAAPLKIGDRAPHEPPRRRDAVAGGRRSGRGHEAQVGREGGAEVRPERARRRVRLQDGGRAARRRAVVHPRVLRDPDRGQRRPQLDAG